MAKPNLSGNGRIYSAEALVHTSLLNVLAVLVHVQLCLSEQVVRGSIPRAEKANQAINSLRSLS